MKSLLKFLFLAGVVTAVIVVITNSNRKRASAPVESYPPAAPPTATPKSPPAETPSVVEPVDGVEAAMSDQQTATLVEASASTAADSPEPWGEQSTEIAELVAGAPETPTEETAPEAESTTAVVSPIATVALESESVFAELDALAETSPDGESGVPVFESASVEAAPDVAGEAPVSELEAPVEAAPSVAGEAPVSESAVAEVAFAPLDEQEDSSKDPDFLTRYFEELAATPEESTPEVELATSPPPVDLPTDALLTSVEEALDDLEPAPILPPPRRTAESYLDEGNVYFNVGQYSLAIERYGQAVSLDQSLTAAYYNRANAHTRAGDFEKALADYDRALELQPNDADALNNRGMLHLYRTNYAAALEDFNQALVADPEDNTVMVNRGLANLHGGNAAAALIDFREAAAMDANDAAAQYGAAQASASLGNRDEALKHVARAMEIDPGYAREAAADHHLAVLEGDEQFLKLLRESGSRPTA